LILISFLVGLAIGLTSLGSGILLTPSLILLAGMSPALAIGTGLSVASLTKVVAAWIHSRQGTVDFGAVGRLAAGSIPGSLIGVAMIRYFRKEGLEGEVHISQALGITLISVAILIVLSAAGIRLPGLPLERLRKRALMGLIPLGTAVGFIVGLTSVGSGSLVTPFLLLLYPEQPSRAVGTDVAHAALLLTVTAGLHWTIANIHWEIVPLLVLGSIPGVVVGSRLSPILPGRLLRVCLGAILLFSGVKLVR
jgi:uncharacterized protein